MFGLVSETTNLPKKMKLKLNATFSTTYVTNKINSPVNVDLSYKSIKSAHTFKSVNDERVMCISISHPLQDGYTTYFLHDPQDIAKATDACLERGIEITQTS